MNEGLSHRREGLRRDVVLELLELLRVHAREEAAHDREHLAELDEDAAETEHPLEQAARVLGVDATAPLFQPRRYEAIAVCVSLREEAPERELRHVAREDQTEDVERAEEAKG